MKRLIIIFGLVYCIVFLLSCSKEKNHPEIDSIDIYIKQDVERMANIANSLNNENRLKFIKNIILNSTFQVPPSDLCKFLSNGEIICIGEGYQYKNNEYDVSYWKLQDDKIYLWKKKNSVPVPGSMKAIWEFKEAFVSTDKKSIYFVFNVYNINDKSYYELEVLFMGKFITPYMEKYIKKIGL